MTDPTNNDQRSLELLNTVFAQSQQAAAPVAEVADLVVEELRNRMLREPEAFKSRDLLEFVARYQANKVAEQANMKDIAVALIQLQSLGSSLPAPQQAVIDPKVQKMASLAARGLPPGGSLGKSSEEPSDEVPQ